MKEFSAPTYRSGEWFTFLPLIAAVSTAKNALIAGNSLERFPACFAGKDCSAKAMLVRLSYLPCTSALPATEFTFSARVSLKCLTTISTYKGCHAWVDCWSVVYSTKFIVKRFGNILKAERDDFRYLSSGNPEMEILKESYICMDVPDFCKPIGESYVFFLGKLFGRYGDARLVPTSVVANERRQRYGMRDSLGDLIGDIFDTVLVKQLSELGEDGGRHCMESSATADFTISLIKIGAYLNFTREGFKPFLFNSKPVELFLRMIAS